MCRGYWERAAYLPCQGVMFCTCPTSYEGGGREMRSGGRGEELQGMAGEKG